MRTVDLQSGAVQLIDQTALPDALQLVECRSLDEIADAIRTMKVRGRRPSARRRRSGMVLGARGYLGNEPHPFLQHLEEVAELPQGHPAYRHQPGLGHQPLARGRARDLAPPPKASTSTSCGRPARCW